MRKPKSVVRFESCFLASVAVWLVAAAIKLAPLALSPAARAAAPPLWAMAAALALVMAINAFLWFFIARRGSNLVRWLLCAFLVFALVNLPAAWADNVRISAGYAVLNVLTTVLQTVALLMLYGEDARLWLSHEGRLPENPTDVFG